MNMKKLMALLMALVMLLSMAACGGDESASVGVVGGEDGPTAYYITGSDGREQKMLPEDGFYYSAEDVSLYLHLYGCLPDNFVTKGEARSMGWTGGSLEEFLPDHVIGGDRFGNREGLLPDADGRKYYECDIDTHGEDSRGAKRIVYSNDGLIYYTEDHYESFTLLYGED